MRVQKGLVKYKDRSDILCTYGTTDDGRTYYFLDGEKLSNGYIVASTALVEAIDPLVVASSIGIVDINGKVIVPFENKSIKPVNDKFLLIENSKPITKNVLDTIAMRKDPLAATKLVSTSAAIKEKMYSKMGPKGRFLFNDQFSEVKLTDLDGKNLCGDKLFSFVGINDSYIFLSDNIVESEIIEYSLVNEVKENIKADSNDLDVRDFKVEKKMIDEAMNEEPNQNVLMPVQNATDEVKEISDEVNANNQVPIPDIPNEDDSVVSEKNADDDITDKPAVEDETTKEDDIINKPLVEEEAIKEDDITDKPVEEEATKEDDIDETEIAPASFDKIVADNNKFEEFSSNTNEMDNNSYAPFKNINHDKDDYKDDKKDDYTYDVGSGSKNIFEEDSKDSGNFNFADILNDKRPVDNKRDFSLDDDYDDNSRDTVFEDTAVIMNKMISQIEEQRHIMADYEDRLKKLTDFKRKAFEENKKLVTRYENLFRDYKSMEDEVSKMQNMIEKQREEIKSLRSQVAGKNELVKLLSKAQSLLDDDYDRGYSKIKTM